MTAAVGPRLRLGLEVLQANMFGRYSNFKERATLVNPVVEIAFSPGQRFNPYLVIGGGYTQYRLLPWLSSIVLPSEGPGPAFLTYQNYRAFFRWNRSHFFAITLGHLADRIAGHGPLEPYSRESTCRSVGHAGTSGWFTLAPCCHRAMTGVSQRVRGS